MQKHHPPRGQNIPSVLGHFNPVFLSVYEQMSCHGENGKHHESDTCLPVMLFSTDLITTKRDRASTALSL